MLSMLERELIKLVLYECRCGYQARRDSFDLELSNGYKILSRWCLVLATLYPELDARCSH